MKDIANLIVSSNQDDLLKKYGEDKFNFIREYPEIINAPLADDEKTIFEGYIPSVDKIRLNLSVIQNYKYFLRWSQEPDSTDYKHIQKCVKDFNRIFLNQ